MARKKGPHVQHAYQYIKDKILTFEFFPGTVLSDNMLSQQLSMSRSPVREAVMLLLGDGLLEVKNGRIQVSPITVDDIAEICEVRTSINIAAVNRIMDRSMLTGSEKERLSNLYNKLSQADDLFQSYKYDDLFHAAIIEMAGNRRLLEISERMRLQIARARWLNTALPERRTEANKEHADIYNALINGNRQACTDAIRTHFKNSAENYARVLQSPRFTPQFKLALVSMSLNGTEQ